MAWFCPEYNEAKDRRCELLDDHEGDHDFPDQPEDSEELEDAEFVSAADLPDDMFPEWDAAAETADDARRGK